MKVILSRKGFDSAAGGYPSPILPDGTLLSLPIPDSDPDNQIKYSDLKIKGNTYLEIMNQLGFNGFNKKSVCHLDPDIYCNIFPRPDNWQAAFGQISAAQSHLESAHIGVGDLFLFFGFFQQTRFNHKKQLEFIPNTQKHIIFGYLQIQNIYKISNQLSFDTKKTPDWLSYHPHCTPTRKKHANNTIYLASENSSWDKELAGFGTFKYNKALVLTQKGRSRSRWRLPDFMRELEITYHDSSNWKDNYFQSASRGQEFVIEEDINVEEWATTLINKGLD